MAAAPVSDYTSLVENVSAYDDRALETEFTDRIPGFIRLFEASLGRNIRSRETQYTTTLTTDATGAGTLPSDFLRVRSWNTINGNLSQSLNSIAQGAIASLYPIDTALDAFNVSINGDTFRIQPSDAASVVLTYDRRFVGLGPSNATNWVITDHPDAYLFGTLAHAAAWLKDWNEAAILGAQAKSFVDEINDQYGQELFNNAYITLEGSTP